MAFTFVSSSNGGGTSVSSVVVTAPINIANNDIIFAIVSRVSSFANSVPTGFSSLGKTDELTNVIELFWKLASSESGDYTWGFPCTLR